MQTALNPYAPFTQKLLSWHLENKNKGRWKGYVVNIKIEKEQLIGH